MNATKIIAIICTASLLHLGVGAEHPKDEGTKVTVTGRVLKPGEHSLAADSDILDAILAAEGFNLYAATNSVWIRRGDQMMKVDVRKLLKSNHKLESPKLLDGDVIIVPHGEFAGPSNNDEILNLIQKMKDYKLSAIEAKS